MTKVSCNPLREYCSRIPKPVKVLAVTILALGIITLLGYLMASGKFGDNAQAIMNHKVIPALTHDVPAWTVPVTVFGILFATLTIAGIKSCHDSKKERLSQGTLTLNEEDS